MSRALVVVTSRVSSDAARRAVERVLGEDTQIEVVAPASNVSRLDWLTNDEDDARSEAREKASTVAQTVEAPAVVAPTGETDPLQAIADALVTFPAEEIVLVTASDDDTPWLEDKAAERARARFGLPITHLVAR